MTHLSSCIVLWKSRELSSATRGPEHGHTALIDLVATEPHFLHLMSWSWYRTLVIQKTAAETGRKDFAQDGCKLPRIILKIEVTILFWRAGGEALRRACYQNLARREKHSIQAST